MRSSEKTKLVSSELLAFCHARGRSSKIPAAISGSARPPRRRLIRRRRSVALEQHRSHRVLGFLHKDHLVLRSHVDTDKISELYLPRRDQIRQWKHQVPFDGALQVP